MNRDSQTGENGSLPAVSEETADRGNSAAAVLLYYENECAGPDFDRIFPFSCEAAAETVIRQTLASIGCRYSCEVSLTLTDEESMRALNLETRGIDRVTDVLSFPMFQYTVPGRTEEAESDRAGSFNPDSGALILGDIVICPARAAAQAEEYGHSTKREFAFLVAHSMLHLLGFDHMTAEQEEEMTARQEEILNSAGITRSV